MGRPSKDRVQMSLYIDRDIAEELKEEKNISETVNTILRSSMDQIGLFGTEDIKLDIENRINDKVKELFIECVNMIKKECIDDNTK